MERWILWISGLLSFCAGALYGWSALIGPVQAAFSVTTAQAGLIFSWAIVSFTAAIIISPTVLTNWSPALRLAAFGGLAAVCVCFAMVSNSYLTFIILFSGGFGAMSGAIYITTLGVASAAKRHKIATPVMVAAFGAGGAVFGPLWRMLATDGWGLNGLLFLVSGLAIASVLLGINAWSTKATITVPRIEPISFAVKQHFGLHFVLIWLVFAFGSFGGLMVLGLASKMMDAAGLGAGLVSVALAGIAIGNTMGRLSVVGFSQIMRVQNCIVVALTLSSLGFVFVSMQSGLTVGLVLIATGYGVIAATVPAITRAAFGSAPFQPIFAIMMTAWGVAGFFAPWVSGSIFDRTGSFNGALWLAAVMIVLCGLTVLWLNQVMRDTQQDVVQ
jgi:OFA family oxalate/formate antiporter-like MFS transporter